MAPAKMAMAARPRNNQQQALLLAASVLFLLYGAPGGVAAATGLVFHVGGPRGWRVPDSNTNYGWWAVNNRFHVGDALYFKYGVGESVLVVDREAFDVCDATEPIARFADGATTVPLDRPGFFCLISGSPRYCNEGQRFIVLVKVHPAEPPGPAPPVIPAPTPGAALAPGPGFGSGSYAFQGATSAAAAVTAGAAAMGVLVGLVLLLQGSVCMEVRACSFFN